MKKLLFASLALLVGAGIVIGYRMAKGEGWSCCGWGGEKVDPWTAYTPPEDVGDVAPAPEAGAGDAAAAAAETPEGEPSGESTEA